MDTFRTRPLTIVRKQTTMLIGNSTYSIKGQDHSGYWHSTTQDEWAIWVVDGAYPLGNESADDVETLATDISNYFLATYQSYGVQKARTILRTVISKLPPMKATATLTLLDRIRTPLLLGKSIQGEEHQRTPSRNHRPHQTHQRTPTEVMSRT